MALFVQQLMDVVGGRRCWSGSVTVYVCENVHTRCANISRPLNIVSIENLEVEVFVYYFYLHIYYLAA
jgi:hypothetical protein